MNRATPQSGCYSCTTYSIQLTRLSFKSHISRTIYHDWCGSCRCNSLLERKSRVWPPGIGSYFSVATFLSSCEVSNLYKLHTSLQKLTGNAQRDRRYHPPQARGFMHMLAAFWACHHTVQASRCGSYVVAALRPACGHMYGDWGRKIVTRIGGLLVAEAMSITALAYNREQLVIWNIGGSNTFPLLYWPGTVPHRTPASSPW